MTTSTTGSECFICGKDIPYSARYPERLCETCMKKAVNQNGEKLSFFNESISGGFISYNESTKAQGNEHICYVNGYQCHAAEAYMGGIVLVPTDQGKTKKVEKRIRLKNISNITLLICAILGPAAIWGAWYISKNGYFDIGFTLFDALIITGSVCLFIFICLSLYRYKILFLLAAVLYAATGYFSTYNYGYRNDAFLDTIAIISLVSAVLLTSILILSTGYISKKTKELQERTSAGNHGWVLLIVIPLLVLIGGHIFFSIKGEENSMKLIETAPGATTIATVKEVQQYDIRGRNGISKSRNEALLEYSVNAKTFYRILDNSKTLYTAGSKVNLQYVVSDPYLVKVSQLKEKNGN